MAVSSGLWGRLRSKLRFDLLLSLSLLYGRRVLSACLSSSPRQLSPT